MAQYGNLVVVLGVIAVLLARSSFSSAFVISCPTNPNAQVASPAIKQICAIFEQAFSESNQFDNYGNKAERRDTKRQDVDHVFLRFGRPYGF